MAVLTRVQLTTAILALAILLTSASPLIIRSSIERSLSDPADPKTLRIMTYNIQQAFDAEGVMDFGRIIETMGKSDPDLIGIQESLPTRQISSNLHPLYEIARALGYYVYQGAGPQYQTPGVSILSKFPIEKAHFIMLKTESLPRTAAGVRVSIQGQLLDFYSVHLGVFSATERVDQVEDLLGFIDETSPGLVVPRIVVGDFNDHPNTTVYNMMTSAGYIDSWTAANNTLNATIGFTYDSYVPYETIDYIFVSGSPAVTVKSCMVITAQYGSDHLPVEAVIKLP